MKVLIVDDSRPLQARLLILLMQADKGMTIKQAFTCKEATEMFSAFDPDVVILDIELPDGSGINLLRRFKEEKSSVSVIIFTNYSSSEFRKSCMDFCAVDYIEKSDLFSLINTLTSLSVYH